MYRVNQSQDTGKLSNEIISWPVEDYWLYEVLTKSSLFSQGITSVRVIYFQYSGFVGITGSNSSNFKHGLQPFFQNNSEL
jgi:hypothetical protein